MLNLSTINFRKLLFIYGLALIGMCGFAQNRCSSKSDKLYSKAGEFYNSNQPEKSLSLLNTILKRDTSCIKAVLLKADIVSDKHQINEAIALYNKALRIDSMFYPKAEYLLANLYFESEQYMLSKQFYQKYLNKQPKSKSELQRINDNLALGDYRISLMQNPEPYELQNLGPAINNDGYEFVNSISLDGNTLLFTRKNATGTGDENFYFSERKLLPDSTLSWQPAIELGEPLNTSGNEGALCMSADEQTVIITACGRRDSYGGCDLYYSQKKGRSWTVPINLGRPVNSSAWESQPCLSADGRTLYFISTRQGGYGGSDIYKTELDRDGYWTTPVNLGAKINTQADEYAPFIHPDGQTLYFSSRGHLGMGGADLFMSKLGTDGQWQKPVNLGYPLNTKNDEINLIINAAGTEGYFSSMRDGGYGNSDIYEFRLPAAVRPEAVSYIRGKVYDSHTLAPLPADFELIGLTNGTVVAGSRADATDGSFIMSLPLSQDYALHVTCPGYLFYSQNFSLQAGYDAAHPLHLDVPLQPVKAGEKVVLRNIFFETGRSELLPSSEIELDKLSDFLKQNTSLHIEISGHTDNQGSDAFNLALSQQRAESVYNYLINKGIDKNRLLPKGYGETQPVESNETPEGRSANRRTEFKVISK